eukprot:TRINITY_DN84124_c0_g1_i1.p1 TRINITY_DN84124_c0_g1~~TRINITY_DN84124_c0_g1_i1.p1  ORF type:complete len:370 (+),score=46.12 TRINITY_DN84124_c0_g1_i1:65-1174(+)
MDILDKPDTSRVCQLASLALGVGVRWLCRAGTFVFESCRCILQARIKFQAYPAALLPAPLSSDIIDLVKALDNELGGAELPESRLQDCTPSSPFVVTFAPCANLCIYGFGVAARLQRAKNFQGHLRAGRIRCRGVSSGGLCATALAMEADIAEAFANCLGGFVKANTRVGGWVGHYTKLITGVVESIFQVAGDDKNNYHRANSVVPGCPKLQLSVTCLSPLPCRKELSSFASNEELMSSALGSCFIPVVWEETTWSRHYGLCLDGAISGFVDHGDIVVGPYHSTFPDIYPQKEFPRALVFAAIAKDDMLRLFEEGFRDAHKWLSAGGAASPDRVRAREELCARSGGLAAMVLEGFACLLEVVGLREKVV